MCSSYLDTSFQQFSGSTNRVLAFATVHEEPFPLPVNLWLPRFPKQVPPLLPHPHQFSMRCTDHHHHHHHHGWSFGHFRTLCAILWRAALSLRYRNITVSMDDECPLEDTYSTHANWKALRTSAQKYLSSVWKSTSAYPFWIASDWFLCHLLHVIPTTCVISYGQYSASKIQNLQTKGISIYDQYQLPHWIEACC